MSTQTQFQEVEDFVRNIRGAGASILWVLLLSRRTLTKAELEQATNYSDAPIRKALHWLASREFVMHHGKNIGWSINRQHPLPFWSAILDDPDNMDFLPQNPELIPNPKEDNPQKMDQVEDNPQKMGIIPAYSSIDSNRSDEDEENLPTTTLLDQNPQKMDQANTVEYWLAQAGIIKKTYHWLEIMGMNLDVHYVKAHVLDFLYANTPEGRKKRDKVYESGLLIFRLERGWNQPMMRCETCFENPCKCAVPKQYEGIIKR